jgi:hypothetical protein
MITNIYSSSNFIRKVEDENQIVIQNKVAEKTHKVNYLKITNTLVSNTSLVINTEDTKITLEFLTKKEATNSLSQLNDLINQLKKGTYNFHSDFLDHSNNSSDTTITPLNFILKIENNGKYSSIKVNTTNSVYVLGSQVFIRSASNGNPLVLDFEDKKSALSQSKKLMKKLQQLRDSNFDDDVVDDRILLRSPNKVYSLSVNDSGNLLTEDL